MSKTASLERVQQTYTGGVRRIATRSIASLARTRITPTMLTAAGVSLCVAASVLVYFEYRNEWLFFWAGAIVFVVGSVLDILDGALARAGGKSSAFGAFIDSTTDRVGEAFVLGAIALALARDGNETALAFTFASLAGSFLVSYTRSKAEVLGLRGDVGIGSRAERVVVITGGLVFAPWGGLQWAIYVLAATAWVTVVQRVVHVRRELRRQQA
ncbi:MAG TPA: CDP-alcohol phosphatidyltransferase family protein [Gaiellaceae bacterium]|nr:CDP-alcohol phosphatidyltransferase family protein [Gaiellaceae bacterium]